MKEGWAEQFNWLWITYNYVRKQYTSLIACLEYEEKVREEKNFTAHKKLTFDIYCLWIWSIISCWDFIGNYMMSVCIFYMQCRLTTSSNFGPHNLLVLRLFSSLLTLFSSQIDYLRILKQLTHTSCWGRKLRRLLCPFSSIPAKHSILHNCKVSFL